jgi:4'-phosphopantetheinyl transferase EntD
MTNLDQSGKPAKESEFRAWHPRTRDVIYLEQPELIKYHPDYQLQKKDENGKWDTFLLSASTSDEDTHQEDLTE